MSPTDPEGQDQPAPEWVAVVSVDRRQFDRAGGDPRGWEFPADRGVRLVPLDQPEIRIGKRTETSEPEIDLGGSGDMADPGTSRLHAFLQRMPIGRYAVIDNGSMNGTWINDELEPIEKYVPVPLDDGDEIHLGAWTTVKIQRVPERYERSFEVVNVGGKEVTSGAERSVDLGEPAARRATWLLCVTIADSRLLRQRSTERYELALDRLHQIVDEAVQGKEVAGRSSLEDRIALEFTSPEPALSTAIAIQTSMPRGSEEAIGARIGIHVEHGESVRASKQIGFAVCLAAHAGQILLSESAFEELGSTDLPSTSFADLGVFRLTDLRAPQHLFQLNHPSLGRSFPPPRSLDSRPHNLPQQLTRFIGRDAEVEAVKQLTLTNRLCTVTGPGGVGKSRIALEVAAGVAVYIPDGVWFADLTGIADESLVPLHVAASLGVREGSSGTFASSTPPEALPAHERLIEHLKDRNALIVLDNCEPVVDAVAAMVEALLRGCETLRILLTSRQAVGVRGEATFRLGPLELPTPRLAPEELRRCASVRLFVDRATLHNGVRGFSDQELATIAEICERVDGLPFAIELAAAQTKFLSVSEIEVQLEDSLRSLDATIAWSLERLSDEERILLRRLSVFAGGFTLEAAQNVCGGRDLEASLVPDLLSALIARSLVEITPLADGNRYRILEATRRYGISAASAAGETEWLQAAHTTWFVEFAEHAAAALISAEQPKWFDAVERDYENLRIAILAAAGADGRDDLRLVGALGRYWLVRGLLTEGSDWIEAALQRSPEPVDEVRLIALLAGTMLDCFASNHERAQRLGGLALETARGLADRGGEALALTLLGLCAGGFGQFSEAEGLHTDSVRAAREAQDWWAEAFALTHLGNSLALRGGVSDARSRYQSALAIRREHHDTLGMFWTLFRLGVLTASQCRYEEAFSLLEESLSMADQVRYGQGSLLALLGLGDALEESGQDVEAETRYREALATARDLDEPTSTCLALSGLAVTSLARKDIAGAARWLTEEETTEAQRSEAVLASVLSAKALLASAEGDDRTAAALHVDALMIRVKLGDRKGVVEEGERLARAWSELGERSRAALVLAAAEVERNGTGLPPPLNARSWISPLGKGLATDVDGSVSEAWSEGRAFTVEGAISRASLSRDPVFFGEKDDQGTAVRLGRELSNALASWTVSLRAELHDRVGGARADELFERYRDAFATGYWIETSAELAVDDIEGIEAAGDLVARLDGRSGSSEGLLELRLLHPLSPISIAEINPVLEHLGVRVLHERAYEIHPAGAPAVWLGCLDLTSMSAVQADAERSRRFEEALRAVWRGDLEDEGLNQLALSEGSDWRDISLLRAYARYSSQVRQSFSPGYVEQTLAVHHGIAASLIGLFHARFGPAEAGRIDQEAISREISSRIDEVATLDEDRILRWILRAVLATVRTNFFRSEGARPIDRISIKLDPRSIPEMPPPVPAHEIFVYAPRVEGVHLRGGDVARGGIRWSDRDRDFRTEIAGLMKAQTLKNAVIVPTGAKGGFVLKRPPTEPAELAEEVRARYRTFISGLLDVTDNIVGGQTVGPSGVTCYDDPDPYLVVAADKGTATFSDLANEISAEFGFWLGDAFASGGSNGYDHKELAITARGAWESVRCHFAGLGIDADREPLTVIGIGDMSGDVFGNGLLRSEHLKLLGAFDHRHVFVEPDPVPSVAFEERRRLFGLPRSSWADYEAGAISHGGGVFGRDAKSVTLTPEVKRMLSTTQESLTPDELIRAMLRLPVDLIYNGGIGTFVRASGENDLDVGDRTNDNIRVRADELRCKVIAEGGNLGVTQRGRVEFALAGGLINSDAIDNSAGVDCSDHEVNVKILLDQRGGPQADRVALLHEMTDEVASLVLSDNELQNRALTRDRSWGVSMGPARLLAIQYYELAGVLDREEDALPTDAAFVERRAQGLDLTVPELGVLLSRSKIAIRDELLRTDVPDDPFFTGELERYFPRRLRSELAAQMLTHPLRREIVANMISNDLLNHAEVTLPYRMHSQTDRGPAEVAKAFVVAREALGMRSYWEAVEGQDAGVSMQTSAELFRLGDAALESVMRWVLRRQPTDLDLSSQIGSLAEPIAELSSRLHEVLEPGELERNQLLVDQLVGSNVSEDVARRAAAWRTLCAVPDIAELAEARGQPITTVASVHQMVGDKLKLGWLRDCIEAHRFETEWEMRALSGYEEELFAEHRNCVRSVLTGAGAESPSALLEGWTDARTPALEQWLAFVEKIEAEESQNIVTLGVALRELHNLASSL
jgi:NAD-specific glutamate dehydrogenase/predicted ATPase